ncbi:DUF2326 domain-containing protein [Fictibacillus sp. WQ 8-8]|uniref:DUF2326 domain-containing protein n=1 Tax=Fictibacillus sp. WQ 8-8 TaxID=2938788 RepID=UPI00210CF497|nr:DUF2326 domain-containing protein [Fictibacillus sp. WQ 8-8]MCQ6268244.1 DUF2326 domain-containing protein [Fictibacillus sp. WQ 8-8]
MLYEIICDRFMQTRVEFHAGLNTVLGDDFGSNSIGKSTFLMIIDFVFGGKDYVMKSSDIQRNIGNHEIKFCFIFNEEKYFFSRTTNDLESVNKCDKNYNILSNISLDNYCELLKDMYQISLNDISFRNIVGRFSRIYGKDNLDEKRPLNIVPNEKMGEPTNALLKLFGLYSVISELDILLKEKESELKAFKNAQKYNYVSSTGKRKYVANLKELTSLNNEKEQISKELNGYFLDIDSIKSEELLQLKRNLSITKRHRGKLHSQLAIIEGNINETGNLKETNFDDLLTFFPDAKVRKLSEIEKFHIEIRKVLKLELKRKKLELGKLIAIAQSEIDELEAQINEIIQVPNLSKMILVKYSNLQKRIEILENENNAFNMSNTLKFSREDVKQRRDNLKLEQLHQLQNIINTKMLEINDYIYSGSKKPPIVTFDKNQYTFETIDDTGTGTSYKSMVVYDLSILELTQLPILIHDSVVLKQISDVAIEKILLKYKSADKQIFISFDKISAYSPISQKILKETKVLELSVNGKELFGWSWNNR